MTSVYETFQGRSGLLRDLRRLKKILLTISMAISERNVYLRNSRMNSHHIKEIARTITDLEASLDISAQRWKSQFNAGLLIERC